MFLEYRRIFRIIKRLIVVSAMGFALLKPEATIYLVLYFQKKSIEAIEGDWGCPSGFNKNACKEYDPESYK